ncbi:unnamed protein product [Paramecium primaurelia]|uniref:Proliferating cell nuclear antigen n=2 Tax=Paramecium TaxID=5884 RepID=A0A8S1UIY3_9CILI|nr:unnamed protein product [Paramecium primaurelia]CAD8163709.1 unnamed protein product [Paramecium pentaurelia]
MFEAKFEDGGLFKKIVEAIKELVKNVNLEANGTGISLQAMDTSHVALVALQLNEKGFKKYRCEKSLTMGLSIENLQKILKCSGNDDQITLRTQDEEPTTLSFTFESKNRISEFQLNLMSLDQEQLGVPDTEYSSVVRMPSNEFTKICRELGNINEAIGIETSKEGIKFYVKGDIGEGQVSVKINDTEKPEERVECEVDEPVNLSFAVRYFNLFNKASALSSQVILSMSQDQPLVIEYIIEEMGSLKLYLAPKINDEESQ